MTRIAKELSFEHILKYVSYFMAGTGTNFISNYIVVVLFVKMVLEIPPDIVVTMSNENLG